MTWSNRFRLYGGLVLVIAARRGADPGVQPAALAGAQPHRPRRGRPGHRRCRSSVAWSSTRRSPRATSVDKGDSLYTIVVPRTARQRRLQPVAAVARCRNAAYDVDPKKATRDLPRDSPTGVLTDVRAPRAASSQSGDGRSPRSPPCGSQYVDRGVPALAARLRPGARRAPRSTSSCPTTGPWPARCAPVVGDHRRRGRTPDQGRPSPATPCATRRTQAHHARHPGVGDPARCATTGRWPGRPTRMVDFLRTDRGPVMAGRVDRVRRPRPALSPSRHPVLVVAAGRGRPDPLGASGRRPARPPRACP